MLTTEQKRKALRVLRTELDRRPANEIEKARQLAAARKKWVSYFPDEGPYRRELYPKLGDAPLFE